MSKRVLLERFAERVPSMKAWDRLASVVVSEETPHGRIGNVVLTSSTGERVTVAGERFRLAVGSRVMRSTDCDLRDDGEKVVFAEGRGFGHGVGLCQWGMEGQAREGRRAGEILRYYYPGSRLVRAY
jgi:stage II sporulation protein D